MSYRERITFIAADSSEEYYDTETATWVVAEPEKVVVPAHVMDLGLERAMRLFGDHKKVRKIATLQHAYTQPFTVIYYQSERYICTMISVDHRAFVLERD